MQLSVSVFLLFKYKHDIASFYIRIRKHITKCVYAQCICVNRMYVPSLPMRTLFYVNKLVKCNKFNTLNMYIYTYIHMYACVRVCAQEINCDEQYISTVLLRLAMCGTKMRQMSFPLLYPPYLVFSSFLTNHSLDSRSLEDCVK